MEGRTEDEDINRGRGVRRELRRKSSCGLLGEEAICGGPAMRLLAGVMGVLGSSLFPVLGTTWHYVASHGVTGQ
eukprot:scaffold63984_cov61-Cyclotella_meneghiniana.AAC.1